jgi:hypothetical protein
MKKLLILSILFVSILNKSFSQTNFKVIGEIAHPDNVYYLSVASKLTSLELKNNKFQIELKKGEFPKGLAIATISKGKIKYLTPTIWIDTDSVNIYFDFKNEKSSFNIDHRYIDQDISEKIEKANNKEKLDLIKENIKTYPAMFFLYEHIKRISLSELESMYSMISEKNKSSLIVQRINDYIKAKKISVPRKGDQFISFNLESKSETATQIDQLSDKHRLLAFVSTGCGYSLASLSELSKLYTIYGEDVDFITIWDDNEKDTWQNAKAELKSVIEWTDLWDKTKFAANYFDIPMHPSFYLIDENGYILAFIKGYNPKKMRKMLAKNLE